MKIKQWGKCLRRAYTRLVNNTRVIKAKDTGPGNWRAATAVLSLKLQLRYYRNICLHCRAITGIPLPCNLLLLLLLLLLRKEYDLCGIS